jgi:hypothetical protein
VSKKTLVWIGMIVGSTTGGFIPILWGGDVISFAAVILSTIGGLVGIWFGYRFGE